MLRDLAEMCSRYLWKHHVKAPMLITGWQADSFRLEKTIMLESYRIGNSENRMEFYYMEVLSHARY